MCDFQIFVKVIGKGSDPLGACPKRTYLFDYKALQSFS